MHIYFVRHGETELNAKHIHQSPSTPLSDKGREQVMATAEILRGVNPDLLLTSEYTRALESARIIGSSVGLSPLVSGFFYEIVRPSKLFGKSHFAPETFWYVVLSIIFKNNHAWRYTDAENFFHISERAQKALEYLESLHKTHASIIVVSHSVFINMMVSYMCNNRILSIRDLIFTFFHVERMKNASIVHLEYNGISAKNSCSWRLIKE